MTKKTTLIVDASLYSTLSRFGAVSGQYNIKSYLGIGSGRTHIKIAYRQPAKRVAGSYKKLVFSNIKKNDSFITKSVPGSFSLPKSNAKTVLGWNSARLPRTFNVWMAAN